MSEEKKAVVPTICKIEKITENDKGEITEKKEFSLSFTERQGDRKVGDSYPTYYQPLEIAKCADLVDYIGQERADKVDTGAVSDLFKFLSRSKDEAAVVDANFVARKFQNFVNEVRTRTVDPLVEAKRNFATAKQVLDDLKALIPEKGNDQEWRSKVFNPALEAAKAAKAKYFEEMDKAKSLVEDEL